MRRLILPALVFALGLPDAVRAQSPVYVVTHIDIAPSFPANATQAQMDQARVEAGDKTNVLLREMAAGCTPAAGCSRFEVLQQTGAANHFTVLQIWKDADALAVFEASPRVKSVRERLGPSLGSPFDERLHILAK